MFRIRKLGRRVSTDLLELKGETDLIIIDSYVLPGFFGKNGYNDRYYGSFFSFMTDEEMKRCLIFPSFLAVKNLKALENEIRLYQGRTSLRLFCKERVLSIEDYARSILSLIQSFILGFRGPKVQFGDLIREELRQKAFTEISFEAFLDYFFMKHLKKLHLSIQIFLDWNENHIDDRALAKGHYDFQLPFKLKAYQSVILDMRSEFYILPTATELKRGLFAKNLAVAGLPFLLEWKRFKNDVQIESSPVFRFGQYKEDSFTHDEQGKQAVLVALPLAPASSAAIMDVIENVAVLFPNVTFYIRCHPLLQLGLPKGISNIVYDEIQKLSQSLSRVSCLVGAGSSVLLEAAMNGVPSIVIRRKGISTQNPVPSLYLEKLTFVVGDTQQAELALQSIFNSSTDTRATRKKFAAELYDEYVGSINRQNFEKLIH